MDTLTDAQLCEESEYTSAAAIECPCFHDDMPDDGSIVTCREPAEWAVRGYSGAYCTTHAADRVRFSEYLRTPNDAPEGGALSHHDRTALDEAVALVRDVLARHPRELHGQIMTAVQASVHGIDAVRHYLEEAR